MAIKLGLAILLFLSIMTAFYFDPPEARLPLGVQRNATTEHPHLKLMTWNIGYAALEDDTRAHSDDLSAVAETILKSSPDAVALQELADPSQLDLLIERLGRRYRGFTGRMNRSDRVEAVLVKDMAAQFAGVPTFRAEAASAVFHVRAGAELREIVFVSAHADAYSAARRRRYTEEVADWATARLRPGTLVLLAGDFNFELNADKETNFFTDNVKHDSEAYSYLLRSFRDLGRDAGDTAINERRIDYLFAPRDSVLLVHAQVLRDAAVGRMDHWPLLVEIEL
jgi:endonuclease/exonuclease/phosphatase family metal-dependent hydrolase